MPKSLKGRLWDDKELAIDWQIDDSFKLIINEKDAQAEKFSKLI